MRANDNKDKKLKAKSLPRRQCLELRVPNVNGKYGIGGRVPYSISNSLRIPQPREVIPTLNGQQLDPHLSFARSSVIAGSDLYIKVNPKSKEMAKKLSRKDGNAELNAQFASETSSATSFISDPASSQALTQSTETSQSTHHSRRYTITASKRGPSGPGQNSKPAPIHLNQKGEVATAKTTRPSIVVSRSGVPKRNNEPPLPRNMIEPSPQEIPSEHWWNQQTEIDEPLRDLPTELEHHVRNGSFSPSSPSRIPRPRRGYPPTSYRDPFTNAEDDEDMYDERPRLPADWKPPGYQPPSDRIESAAEPQKHLRSRRLSGPASTKAKKPSPTPSPSPAIPTKDIKAAASIDIAPTPYSSPEVTAPIAAHSRSRSTSHTSAFFQRTRRSEGGHLPPPEKVYGQTIYFTNCPHTSPPASRPLDTHPILQALSPQLLKVPSHTIKAELDLAARTGREKQIYTISGLCPECDWKARRKAESDVLHDFAKRRYKIGKHVAYLEMQEGEEEPASPLTPEQPVPGPSKNQMDLQLHLLTLESDVEELEALQDREVKNVWRGYAARWGPGAGRIQRRGKNEEIEEESRAGSRVTAGTTGTRSSIDNVEAEGRMKLDWIRQRKH